MRTKRFLLAGLLPALLFTGVASAQDVPLDVEIGYRFSDVNGNEEMFRSQLDEKAGLQLRSLSWGLGDIRDKKYIDHFRIDAADLGAGPNGLLRVEAGRTGLWKLSASWRRTERYSNLPTIANPFLGSGVLDSQHAYDRTRNSVDVDLELLPGKKIRPLVGFSYSRYSGPGLTTYHVGQDDFQLQQDLKERDTEYRVGVAFDAGPVSGQVVQGWRQFRSDENLKLLAGSGNESGTILGVPVSLDSLTRRSKADFDTPVTSAVVSGKLGSAIRLTGTYVRADADGVDTSSEVLTGNLVSYEILRYFKGLSESSSATAAALSWRGSIRADVHVASGLDVSAGYTRRNRELRGHSLVSDLWGTTTTFSGFDPRDVTTILESRTRMERDEDIFDLRASVKLGKPFTFRIGISQNDADIDVRNDPSEIVVPGAQGGRYGRRVFGIDAGFAFKHEGLALGVEFNRQKSDDAVLRTDFLERDRLRLRGTWEAAKWLRIGATAEQVDTSNNDFGYGLEGEMTTYAGDVEIGPLEWLRLRFGAGRFEGDSSIGYRQPQSFVDATSIYRERGDSLEGGVSVNFKPFTLEALLRRFENDGSFPYELDRARVRASYDVTKLFGVAAEWDLDDYTEKDRSYGSGADFKANRYGLYLRIHP
jgi:hypothetical protein